MATGKIKWFNPTKGYGFIENDAGGKDVFLHISALEEAGIDQLQEGEAVSFEIGEIDSGKYKPLSGAIPFTTASAKEAFGSL